MKTSARVNSEMKKCSKAYLGHFLAYLDVVSARYKEESESIEMTEAEFHNITNL